MRIPAKLDPRRTSAFRRHGRIDRLHANLKCVTAWQAQSPGKCRTCVKLPIDQFQNMPAKAATFQPHINKRISAELYARFLQIKVPSKINHAAPKPRKPVMTKSLKKMKTSAVSTHKITAIKTLDRTAPINVAVVRRPLRRSGSISITSPKICE